jgi:hypothetical protein
MSAAEVARLEAWIRSAEEALAAREAEVETLRAALDEYGQHKAGCAANYSARPAMRECDCGLAAARGGDAT